MDLNTKLGDWNTATKGYYLLDEKSHISNLTIEYKPNPKSRQEKIKFEVILQLLFLNYYYSISLCLDR